MLDKDSLKTFVLTLIAENGITPTETARVIGMERKNFKKKLDAGTLRFLEIQKILEHFGYTAYIEKDKKIIKL